MSGKLIWCNYPSWIEKKEDTESVVDNFLDNGLDPSEITEDMIYEDKVWANNIDLDYIQSVFNKETKYHIIGISERYSNYSYLYPHAIGYYIVEGHNFKDIFYSKCDYVKWYVDENGELSGCHHDHDNNYYITYRLYKGDIERFKENPNRYNKEWLEKHLKPINLKQFKLDKNLVLYENEYLN